MRLIDNILNRFTMYQVTLYVLIFYVMYAAIFGFLHMLPYTGLEILLSALLTVASAYTANYLFAKFFHAVTNFESGFITALILTLIIPAILPLNGAFLVLGSILAMAIKYLPTVNKRHLFNPAAGAVAAYSLLFRNYIANWWIGTPIMFIPVLIGGFLVARKAQRQETVIIFLTLVLAIIGCTAYIRMPTAQNVLNAWETTFMRSAVVFFASIMFTEPITSPSTQVLRTWYSYIVAFLYTTPQIRLFSIILTPEQALLIGNVFSFIVNPKYRLELPLTEIQRLSPTIYGFVFPKDKTFTFKPGQYMEWTLPHNNMDTRGNRRFLSLASSPTENAVFAVVRFYTPPSSYKKALVNMKPGDKITAINLSGDFTLPKNLSTPIAFIAGGVGITPFRSMIKYITDKKIKADVVLLFINKVPEEIIFQNLFKEAEQYGVKTIYNTTSKDGHITEEILQRDIPDYKKRIFYLSGSQPMVQSIKDMLQKMKAKEIKTDFFPGYFE